MSYQVIARKWRPQTFEDLVGQETVTRTLQNALVSGRIAHAFLFSGVRGVGKTTAARILAKALNCHQGISPQPCGECVSCEEIRGVNCVDVQEIDAASNRGIDSIRELRDSVRYGTARDRFKIFIIDEVHMLTNEAFNALLKTLEEPPAHVKFIMATTEYHKIPPTITSRCQKYEFKPISFSAIRQRLMEITVAEGIETTDFALSSIATLAQGSMRDAQSALDQIIAFSGKKITDDDVTALLGLVDQRVIELLVDSVLGKQPKAVIEQVRDLSRGGISPHSLTGKLLEHVRNLLVCKIAGWDPSLIQLADSSRETLLSQEKHFSELDLIRFYDVLNRASNELKWHSQPEVHLEMTLLKLIELAGLPRIEEVIGRIESAGVAPSSSSSSRPLPAAAPQRERAHTSSPDRERSSRDQKPPLAKPPVAETPQEAQEEEEEEENNGPGPEAVVAPNGIGSPVNRFMGDLQKKFMGLYQQLQFASEIIYNDGTLRISFPAAQQFHASSVGAAENFARLSETFAAVAGTRPKIDIQITGEEKPNKTVANITDDPRIQSFLDRFPGKVIVKRDFED